LTSAPLPGLLLGRRIAAEPAQAAMRDDTDTRFGHAWCGGLIEASIREMLDGG